MQKIEEAKKNLLWFLHIVCLRVLKFIRCQNLSRGAGARSCHTAPHAALGAGPMDLHLLSVQHAQQARLHRARRVVASGFWTGLLVRLLFRDVQVTQGAPASQREISQTS